MLSFCKNTNNNKMSNKKSQSEMYDIHEYNEFKR